MKPAQAHTGGTTMKTPEPRRSDIRLDQIDGYPRLVLSGEGNKRLAARIEQGLDRLINAGCRRFMLDTREVRYLDNSCCLALTDAIERLRAGGGECVIVDQSDALERSLKLLSLGATVEAVQTVNQTSTYLSWSH
jgi:anti-anti-sigma factor